MGMYQKCNFILSSVRAQICSSAKVLWFQENDENEWTKFKTETMEVGKGNRFQNCQKMSSIPMGPRREYRPLAEIHPMLVVTNL